jgi:hypothetical protein
LSSKLSFVVGAGLDPAGNLYIVDPNNVAVEKVTPGGTLSILAGTGQSGPPVPGPASNSTLNNPAGVASDSAGNLYIADQGNHAIEKIAADGTLSVFAGIPGVTGLPAAGPATSSHLNNPDAIATDSAATSTSPTSATGSSRRSRRAASSPSSPVFPARRAPRRRDPPPARTSTRPTVSPSTRPGTSTSPTEAPM